MGGPWSFSLSVAVSRQSRPDQVPPAPFILEEGFCPFEPISFLSIPLSWFISGVFPLVPLFQSWSRTHPGHSFMIVQKPTESYAGLCLNFFRTFPPVLFEEYFLLQIYPPPPPPFCTGKSGFASFSALQLTPDCPSPLRLLFVSP